MTEENVGEQITESLRAVFGEASPATVFSQPAEVGDVVVITAAAWERAGGFGFGSGYGEAVESGEQGGGSGGGGGGASQGRPVAVITVSPHGVDVRPVIDFTKIGITLLLSLIGLWRALRR
jgi:uncharacterized spore protein YtfJ